MSERNQQIATGGMPGDFAGEDLGAGPVTLATVPRRRRLLRVRLDGDGLMVKRRLSRNWFRLNRTGKAIWLLCDGTTSIGAMFELLEVRFEGAESQMRQNVMATLDGLKKAGLVTFLNQPGRRSGNRVIDLRNIPFYVINCEGDTTKRAHMAKQLTRLGLKFEFMNAVECSPGSLGTTLSHLKILNQSHIEPPFGVFEDDCVFNDNFRYEFPVPMATDAFYLGVSRFGIEKPGELSWGKWDHVRWSRYDRHNLRVLNMLGLHAIIYMSPKFREAARASVLNALTHEDWVFPGDVGVAATHLDHLVLTPIHPVCYQASEFGGQEASTELSLTML